MDELADEEVGLIVQLLKNCKNVSAGQVELVLAAIFWVFYKFVMGGKDEEQGPGQKANASQIFQLKHGDEAIEHALAILDRNLCRVTDA